MLRGLVIILMVLDHVRDFFHYSAFRFDPTDPAKTTLIIFSTRWVTHLCAPTFVFLAGLSIFFQKQNGKPGGELGAFLVKRGLWLILLEVTIVSFGFNFGEPMLFLQVIWAIGASMVAMAILSRLPSACVLVIGLVLLATYPVAAAATSAATGGADILRTLTIAPKLYPTVPVLAFYPMVPWLGVMCLGFGLGPIFQLESARQASRLTLIAIGSIALFLVLRALNGYGDPAPWAPQHEAVRSAMSFLNVSKYPPSPDFVLATLGVALLLFLALEKLKGLPRRVLLTFGRTPLFTYICHIYLAHLMMLLLALALGFPAAVATDFLLSGKVVRMNWGVSLPIVYALWAIVLLLLYPASRWFEEVKRRRRDWWLSYL